MTTTVQKQEIAALFDRWNESLLTEDPKTVVANYAEESILLPTISNKPRLTSSEKEDYFVDFLTLKPEGKIELSHIDVSGDLAVDSGIYEFTLHSSGEKVRARYSFAYRNKVFFTRCPLLCCRHNDKLHTGPLRL